MSRKLFVGNLPYSVTSERLQEAFSQFGTVTSSKVIVDRETGRSRGFAFLEMETDDQGAAAMQAMNGSLLDGRSIGAGTSKTPNVPMHYILQTEACLFGCPKPNTAGHVYLDWIAIWKRS